MLALTLWQPWASAIVRGPKRVENRPWAPWKRVLGERILIHAGKTWDKSGAEFCETRGFQIERDAAPLGAIVGSAVVVAAVHVNDRHGMLSVLNGQQRAALNDPWFFGPWGWILDEVRAYENPFSCNGAQGLWTPPADVLERIRATAMSKAAGR